MGRPAQKKNWVPGSPPALDRASGGPGLMIHWNAADSEPPDSEAWPLPGTERL